MSDTDLTARAEELAQELGAAQERLQRAFPEASRWPVSTYKAPEIVTVLRALVAQVHQLRDRVNGIPGLTAALDEARWERDVVQQREPAAGQALAEIERLRNELVAERALVAEVRLMRPVVAAVEFYVDKNIAISPAGRRRHLLCLAVDAMRAQRGGR